MKKFYFILMLCWSFSATLLAQDCPTGTLMIQDLADINDFLQNYPDCTELEDLFIYDGSITNLNAFSNIETITGNLTIWGHNMASLNGLQNITSIDGDLIIAENNSLTDISALSNLEHLGGGLTLTDCPEISSISAFQSLTTAEFITLSNLQDLQSLDGLQNITHLPGGIQIEDCAISDLNDLSSLTHTGGLKLIDLPFVSSLEGLVSLETIDNDGLHLDAVYGLSNLVGLDIELITSNLRILNCYNLTSFEGLGGIAGNFDLVQIEDNTQLSSLQGLDNIELIEELLMIKGNPSLFSCAIFPVCFHLDNSSAYVIESNGIGCNNKPEIMDECENAFSTVNGKFFFDLDCDEQLGNEEFTIPNFLVFREPNGTPVAFSDSDGNYSGFMPLETSWNIYGEEYPYFSTNPESFNVTTAEFPDFYGPFDFAYCPDTFFCNLELDLTSSSPPRPGFQHTYHICIDNQGTLNTDFTLYFSFSDLPSTENVTILDTDGGIVNNDTVIWVITEELLVFHQRCFEVTVEMDPDTEPGIFLEPYAIVSTPEDCPDLDPSNNWARLYQQVVASCDPNDKTFTPEDYNINNYNLGQELDYLIRFQNTGTYHATFVEVLDTIEANLDLSTFRMISASHDYSVSFPGERVIKWRFDDINLPDSTSNELESHGFIKFSIAPVEGLEVNDEITNRCGIYFDFNAPVITNTATTVLSDPTGVFDRVRNDLAFTLFPNPADERLTIQILEDISEVELMIYDVSGGVALYQKAGVGIYQIELSLEDLSSGMYFVKVIGEEHVGIQKLIIE